MAINHLFGPRLYEELFRHNVISCDGRIIANEKELTQYKAFLVQNFRDKTTNTYNARKHLVDKTQALIKAHGVGVCNKELILCLNKLGLQFSKDGNVTPKRTNQLPERRAYNPKLSLYERQITANLISRKIEKRDLKQLDDWLSLMSYSKIRVQKMAPKKHSEWKEELYKYRVKTECVVEKMAQGRHKWVTKINKDVQIRWMSAAKKILKDYQSKAMSGTDDTHGSLKPSRDNTSNTNKIDECLGKSEREEVEHFENKAEETCNKNLTDTNEINSILDELLSLIVEKSIEEEKCTAEDQVRSISKTEYDNLNLTDIQARPVTSSKTVGDQKPNENIVDSSQEALMTPLTTERNEDTTIKHHTIDSKEQIVSNIAAKKSINRFDEIKNIPPTESNEDKPVRSKSETAIESISVPLTIHSDESVTNKDKETIDSKEHDESSLVAQQSIREKDIGKSISSIKTFEDKTVRSKEDSAEESLLVSSPRHSDTSHISIDNQTIDAKESDASHSITETSIYEYDRETSSKDFEDKSVKNKEDFIQESTSISSPQHSDERLTSTDDQTTATEEPGVSSSMTEQSTDESDIQKFLPLSKIAEDKSVKNKEESTDPAMSDSLQIHRDKSFSNKDNQITDSEEPYVSNSLTAESPEPNIDKSLPSSTIFEDKPVRKEKESAEESMSPTLPTHSDAGFADMGSHPTDSDEQDISNSIAQKNKSGADMEKSSQSTKFIKEKSVISKEGSIEQSLPKHSDESIASKDRYPEFPKERGISDSFTEKNIKESDTDKHLLPSQQTLPVSSPRVLSTSDSEEHIGSNSRTQENITGSDTGKSLPWSEESTSVSSTSYSDEQSSPSDSDEYFSSKSQDEHISNLETDQNVNRVDSTKHLSTGSVFKDDKSNTNKVESVQQAASVAFPLQSEDIISNKLSMKTTKEHEAVDSKPNQNINQDESVKGTSSSLGSGSDITLEVEKEAVHYKVPKHERSNNHHGGSNPEESTSKNANSEVLDVNKSSSEKAELLAHSRDLINSDLMKNTQHDKSFSANLARESSRTTSGQNSHKSTESNVKKSSSQSDSEGSSQE